MSTAEFIHGPPVPARNKTGRETTVVKALVSPTTIDIHRAAAWWGGEGSVVSGNGHLSVTFPQNEKSVCQWFVDRFGGAFSKQNTRSCYVWRAHGSRARGFIMTIYACLPESPRRQKQIREALKATSEIKKRGPKPSFICSRGHEKNKAGRCMSCEKIWRDRHRAKPEVAEKRRKQERERYYMKKRIANG